MADGNMQAISAILVLMIFYLLVEIRKRRLFLQTLRWMETSPNTGGGVYPEKRRWGTAATQGRKMMRGK